MNCFCSLTGGRAFWACAAAMFGLLFAGGQFAAAQSTADVKEYQRLALIYERLNAAGKWNEAADAAEHMLEFSRQRRLDKSLELAAMHSLAEARRKQGRSREAIGAYEDTLRLAKQYKPPNAMFLEYWAKIVSYCFRGMGLCRFEMGDLEGAIHNSQEAVDFSLQAKLPLEAAEARSLLARALANSGEFARAETEYRSAISVLEQASRQRNALQVTKTNYADTLSGLASVYSRQDRFDLAEPYQRRAVGAVAAAVGWQHPYTATLMSNLATIYIEQHRHAEVELLLREAVKTFAATSGLDDKLALLAQRNLALVYYGVGRHDEAEALMREVLERKRRLHGDDHPSTIESLRDLAFLQSHLERYDEAERLAREVHERAERVLGSNTEDAVAALRVLAIALGEQGGPKEAVETIDRALALQGERRMSASALSSLHSVRARYLWKLGQKSAAVDAMELSARLAEQRRAFASGGDLERSLMFAQFESQFAMLVDWYVELGRLDDAFAAIEATKARSFLDELRLDTADLLSGRPEAERQRLMQQEAQLRRQLTQAEQRLEKLPELGRNPAAELLAQHRQAAAEVSAARNALYQHQSDLKNSSSVYRELMAAGGESITLKQLQQEALEEGDLLLSYYLGGASLGVMAVSRQGVAYHYLTIDESAAATLGVEAGELNSQKLSAILFGEQGVLTSISSPAAAPSPELVGKLHALWEVLIPAPQRAALTSGQVKLLAVLPDGPLALLPLEALVVEGGQSPRYLLDAGPPVIYAPSATVLRSLANRDRQQRRTGETLLTLGDPAYGGAAPGEDQLASRLGVRTGDQRFRAGLSRLPFSGWEATWVAEHFIKHQQPAIRLSGAQATEANVRASAPGREIVHLACHGMTDDAYGNMFGCLALAPGKPGDPNDDGFLYSDEIRRLDLSACELAILSACETNYGPQQTGEGVWNLSRAFLVAGARRVVASNWIVDDEAAATLVSFLAANLAKSGGDDASPRDYAAALHKAKRDVRERDKWNHPFYWSSLVHVGPK